MSLKTSSNGKVLYIYSAGNTIDLYDAETYQYLRTITLDGDMTDRAVRVADAAGAGDGAIGRKAGEWSIAIFACHRLRSFPTGGGWPWCWR